MSYDVIVIGSGPSGQKAAIQAAKSGCSVAVVEKARDLGGECVHRGTIPSKSLREHAVRGTAHTRDLRILLQGVGDTVRAHVRYQTAQLERNGVECHHGRASFVDAHTVRITAPGGQTHEIRGHTIVIACGSVPRQPPGIPIDHDSILDSDSFLSMAYLPRSLVVLGAGVIASEYASVFQTLAVTMVNRGDLPIGFLDPDLSRHFLTRFEAAGGRYLGSDEATEVSFDGAGTVTCRTKGGQVLESDKVLVALGRSSNLRGLNVQAAGITPTSRGLIETDDFFRTRVGHIYAVGDVAGPPALAATGMEQGRRAVCHALAIDAGSPPETIPIGIYTIPELAQVGLTEDQAIERHGAAIVGRAHFDEVARGWISGATDGLLKLVATPDGERLLGAQVAGEGATELVHIAQMALLASLPVDTFVHNVFNFPTMAEAYRVAALDIAGQTRATRATRATQATKKERARSPKRRALSP